MTRMTAIPQSDPRHYQLAVLTGLLVYGVLGLELDVDAWVAAVVLTTALAAQRAGARLLGLPFDWRSPLISALSLCLLLRTSSLAVAALASLVAIASKFLVRCRGKHLFNPSALGLVAVVLATDAAWVSPAQWGSVTLFAFLIAALGMLVVYRAARSDVSLAFLAAWCAVVFARALWLGDPLSIPLRQLQSGALVLFTFFMISDPKTTPDSRAGRVLFACLVALGAGLVQFGLYRPNGPLYALVALSVLVPALDRLLPGERYRWKPTREPRECPAPREALGHVPSITPQPLRVPRVAASFRPALAPRHLPGFVGRTAGVGRAAAARTEQRTIPKRSLRCDP